MEVKDTLWLEYTCIQENCIAHDQKRYTFCRKKKCFKKELDQSSGSSWARHNGLNVRTKLSILTDAR